MLFKQTISTLPFKQWLWRDQENKRLIWFSVMVMIFSFGWLKYVYPFPNFMPPDSYSYLTAANNNDFINIWPIGYSKFLRLVSVFSQSDMALVILQYLFLMFSVLYFLFSICYLLCPGKWLFRVLFTISIANPLLPHIANFVSSDCLFASISLIWFTQLLWIIYKPTTKLLIVHAILVLFAFMVRFTAIYYPLVSVFIILIPDINIRTRWIGITLILFLILCFIGRTQYEYNVKTGTIQYSAFAGWQLAASALYGYAHTNANNNNGPVPGKFRELHKIVNQHMDSVGRLDNRPDAEPGIYYFWDFKSPLLLYLYKHWPNNKNVTYFQQWATVAPLYSKYGRWLIAKYPGSFIKYYVWPNLIRYYGPPPYFMGAYNMGKKTVDPIVVSWFNWENNQLPTRLKNRQIYTMTVFPIALAIINPAFIVSILFFICFGGFSYCNTTGKRILACMLLVWFSNTIFSILSAPIELRYQIFPVVITLPLLLIFISWILQSLKTAPIINKQLYNLSDA